MATAQRKRKFTFKPFVAQKVDIAKTPPFPKLVYAAFATSIITVLFVILVQKYLPPEVPLYYGLALGEEQLTRSFGLILPGTLSFVITAINTLIAVLLGNKFLQKTLVLTSFAVSMLSLITTIKIVFLVGSF